MFALRLSGSLLAACVVVFTMLVVGLEFYGSFADEKGTIVQPVVLLSAMERLQLAEALGEDTEQRRQAPKLERIPPAALPPRQVRGFVQVEFTVEPDGAVSEVEVVGATPAGLYEEQARALIRSRHYTPQRVDNRAIASRRTEIVDFSVVQPAEAP